MSDAVLDAGSSPAAAETSVAVPVEVPLEARLAKLTPEQRTDWKLTGKFPSADTLDGEVPEHVPDSDPDLSKQDPSKPKRDRHSPNADRRIGELTAEKRQLERDRDAERAEVARLRQLLNPPAATTPKPAETPAATDAEAPNPDDYGSMKEYNAALSAYIRKVTAAALHSEREAARVASDAERQAQRHQTAEEKWAAQVEAASTKYLDFQEKVYDTKWPAYTDAMSAFIQESDASADVAYYLGTHHDEIRQIAALPPVRQVAALTKIEAKFEAPPAPNHKETLRTAPKPPADVGGRSGPVKDPLQVARENNNFREIKRIENEREIALLKQG